jgi:hypothetical protein
MGASISNYRGGVVNTQALPCVAGHAIAVGDLVYTSGGYAYPAEEVASLALLGAAFAGVAVRRFDLQPGENVPLNSVVKPLTSGGKYWVEVATSGDFGFTCATGSSWAPGDLVTGKLLVYGTDAVSWVTATAYPAGALLYDGGDSNKIYRVLKEGYTSTDTTAAGTDVAAGWLRRVYLHNQKVGRGSAALYASSIGVVKLPYNALGKTTLTEVIVSIRTVLQHEETMSAQ